MQAATLPGLRVRGTGTYGEAAPEAPVSAKAEAPAKKAGARKATEPMKNFIRVLLKEREGVAEAEAIRSTLNEVRPSELTFAMARTSIEALKKIPKPETPVVGRKQPGDPNIYAAKCEHCGRMIGPEEGVLGKSDSGTWIVTHGDTCPTAFPFPEGRYAVASDVDPTMILGFFHCADDGQVYRMASDNEILVPHSTVGPIIAKIAADPTAAAILYGKEFGRCGLCNRGLTNEISRAAGIGPVCAARL